MTGRGQVTVIVIIVLLILFGPLVVIGLPQTVGADRSFVMISGSMSPDINTGDVVIVRSVPPETIQAGDVITFRHEGKRTTHQVVAVVPGDDGPTFRTKGIANPNMDPFHVHSDQLIGRVVLVVPWVGQFLLVQTTSWLALGLFAVPVVFVILVRHFLEERDLLGDSDDDG